MEHLLQQNRAWIFAHPEHLLSSSQIEQLTQWLQALQSGQPLAYITGEQMFWDLNLKVNSHTLIPRPDTEILIETAIELLANNPPTQILDLGTGSGALALVLAKVFSKADVMAVDYSVEALAVAKNNARLNQISNIEFQQSDWFDGLKPSQFDLIVCNPPYIAADDSHLDALRHEPIKALIADQNGLGDYLRIIANAKDFLVKGGLLMFEHGWQQQQQVQSTLSHAGFKNIDSRKDLAGHDRITFAYKP
ncbi:Peptide chain release factor N(5)-glutamine methyltransferase [hydrothermal vent metagenome]|uniref:Peptide chain release factor N(5)-glutamine methyltransferase n=1 Tax=hydrothermal vent metagenome TaxID=652676 RepID=A0A3B0WM20_9ZZZZ